MKELKLTQSGKAHIRGIWDQWINMQAKNPGSAYKEDLSLLDFLFFFILKTFPWVTLVSLTLRSRTRF